MSLEPPLFTAPIHGVRTWEVVPSPEGEPMLCGWAVSQVWPPGEPYRATCAATRFRRVPAHGRVREPHLAPHPRCTCGIYAMHPSRLDARRELARKLDRCETCGVIGAIEAWGRIEVHASGFRAERARPVTFFRCGGALEPSRGEIEQLAAAYGARIVELEDPRELSGAFAELHGLDRGIVRGLIDEVTDLELTPFRTEREERAGRTVHVTGLRVAPTGDPDGEGRVDLTPDHLVFPVVTANRALLRGERFNLGRDVRLEPRPGRAGRHGLLVLDESGAVRAGWAPAGLVPVILRLMRGSRVRAVVASHGRLDSQGPRHSIEVVVAATRRISVWVGKPRHKVALDPDDPIF
jgi:hypothetical protein